MKRYLTTIVASVALATMVLASSTDRAEAHRGWGGVGAGIAAALIIGGIYHHRHHHHRYYGYGYPYRYYGDYPYDDGYGYGYYRPYRHYGYRPHYRHYGHHHRRHWR